MSIQAITVYFSDFEFKYIDEFKPHRDQCGFIVDEMPQSRFKNSKNITLHKYGAGPFCRFRIARGMRDSGVYAIMENQSVMYVGECQSLTNRYGSAGYGGISPRNCFRGGQQTNCRINALILEWLRAGKILSLWFSPAGDKAERFLIEGKLITSLKPIWNL